MFEAIRKDSNTAFFSHSWTTHASARLSATRNVPASSSSTTVSTALPTSGVVACGVLCARRSKRASMVARRLLYNVGSRKLIAAIERAHQCVLNPLAGLVVQYPVLRIGDVEDVLGALAYGHDLRAVDGDALGFEHLPDLGQEAGPVGRDQFQDRAAVAGVQAEVD